MTTVVTLNGPNEVETILRTLLAQLAYALRDTEAGEPARTFIAHGATVTWDSEQAWVRNTRVYPSTESLGFDDQRYRGPGPLLWAVDVELAVLRATATVQDAGGHPLLPTPEQVGLDSVKIEQDLRAMRNVVQFLSPYRKDQLFRGGEPLGPAGGLAGARLLLTVRFQDCAPTVA